MRPRFILTLNSRFAPPCEEASYGFGVVGFIVQIARTLASRQQFCGFLLYRRCANLRCPSLTSTSVLGYRALELCFNFDMPMSDLRAAFATAVERLTDAPASPDTGATPVVVYHQTNTLLPLTPADVPFLVTHHGPFASEVHRLFGRDLASAAFQGGGSKVEHLLASQERGVEHLRASGNGIAVELSTVQVEVLQARGVPSRLVWRIPPPISPTAIHDAERTITSPVEPASSDRNHDELHLVTATARLDAFKNVSQLIATANRLTAARVPVRLSMFVGGPDEAAARTALGQGMCEPLRARSRVVERLGHGDLVRFLSRHRERAIFVCTSLYETFGITPLEAVLAGMTTLVPDRPQHVGITDYLCPSARFGVTETSLAERLMQGHRRREWTWRGLAQRQKVLSRVGPERCVDALTEAAANACRTPSAPRPMASRCAVE